MEFTSYSWRSGVFLGFTLAATLATAPAYAQLVSTATNDAYANNSALRFNYAEALQKSVYFLEAQQNGPLSPNNRVAWRGNANLSDGSDIGRNLAGGLFDAGDHWTTNTSMAFVTTTVAWSAVEKPTGWTSTGQMDELLESLVTINDYFIKCVLNPNVSNPAQNLDVVIGCGGREGVPTPQVHAIWASAEMASAIDLTTGQPITNRPTFRLNSTAPGGDVPAAMASAMAASSMVIRAHGHLLVGKNGFASFNPTAYADQLYDLASKLAQFANANKGAAILESMTDAEKATIRAYRSRALRGDGQVVDIQTPTGYRANPIAHTFTALTWLARATSDPTTRQSWVTLAEQVYEGPYKAENLNDWWRDYSWDNPGKLGAYNMIRLFPTSNKYHYEVQYYAASYLGYGQTPGGLRLREMSAHEYGSLRHSNNAGVIALYYSDLVDDAPVLDGNTGWKHGASNATLKAEFIRAAKRGTDYALGANPYGRSYLIGFGNQPFNSSHHRGAHGAWNGFDHFNSSNPSYNHNASRHILYGALIAGPDNRDVFLASDNGVRTWQQVSGSQEFDTHYIFPNRPTERVRKTTYTFNPADQPVQEILDSKFNEVALDYNAGFMANLAWLNANNYSDGSPIADNQFPPAVVRNESLDPWTTDREMLVTATITEDSSSATQLDGKVWNRSRWPARPLTSPSIRYYFTHTGTVTPTLSNATGASISAVLTDGAGQRYVEITWSGVTLNPVNSSNNVRDFTLRLAATDWNSSDDWSLQNAALDTLRLLPNTPVYQSGALVGGAPPGTAPSAPSALAVVANSSTQITLTWTDNGTNETGFKIERSANGTTDWSQIATPSANATTYADTGLTASTAYFYRVRATNTAGDSAFTSVANATTQAAGSSALLTGTVIGTAGSYSGGSGDDVAKVFDGNLNTFFDAPAANGAWAGLDFGSAVTITEVRYAPRSDFAGRMVGAIIQGSSSANFIAGVVNLHTITSAPTNGTLTSQAIGNATGFRYARILMPNGSNGNVAELQFYGVNSGTTSAPSAPSSLSATANSSTQITLTWTDNATNETGFKIERSANGTTGWSQIATPVANATTFTNTGLTSSTAYFYRVRATNAVGDSANTNVANATTQAAGGGLPVITASGENPPNEDRSKAFDGQSSTKWLAFASTAWLQYAYPAPSTAFVTSYALTSANDTPGRDPRNWQLLGSNDGSAWITLDTRSNQTFSARFQRQLFTVASPAAYAYYRLNITANNGEPNTQLAELELLVGAPAPTGVQTFRTANSLATNGSQDLLIPAGDGTTNLLKYAFNMLGTGTGQASTLATPNASILTANGSAGLPFVGVGTGPDAGKLQLTFIRRKSSSAPGITYAVEFSDALSTWAVNSSAVESVTSIDITFERVTVTDNTPVSAKRFARVRVNAP